jgi:hypothetical protein
LLDEDKDLVLAFTMFNAIDESNQEITLYSNILDIPSNDIYQRLSNYINQFESLGKANPFYGLMRKKITQQAVSDVQTFFDRNVWASDMLFVFQMISFGGFAVSPTLLFHKRIVPSASSGVVKQDWISYLSGYEYLVKKNTQLNYWQKKKLIQEIWLRKLSRKLQLILSKLKRIFRRTKSLLKKFILK